MELPRYHRLRSTFYRMEAARCTGCGVVHFPPRSRCHLCGGDKLESLRLSGQGRVVSVTRVYQPARGFRDSAGAATALIELQEGVRVIAQLTDIEPDEAAPGLEVEMVVRRLRADHEEGFIVYGYKFRPLMAAAEGSATG